MRVTAGVLLAFSLAAPAGAGQLQQAGAPLPSFEVATIRPTPPGKQGNGVWSSPGVGSFSANSISLQFLIQMAFGVDGDQISGKPKWLDSDFFDVVAKPEGGIPLTREQLRPRLQSLLQERFHLVTHRQAEMVRGYALVAGSGGLKLKPAKGDRPPGYRVYVGPGRIEGLNWSMPYLATMLQRPAGLPVIDRTGIAGSYDIKLEFAPDLENASPLPSFFTSLRETLGLELKPQKIPVEVLVIDRVDRLPTEN